MTQKEGAGKESTGSLLLSPQYLGRLVFPGFGMVWDLVSLKGREKGCEEVVVPRKQPHSMGVTWIKRAWEVINGIIIKLTILHSTQK